MNAAPAAPSQELPLFIHVTTGLAHCYGCHTTRGVNEVTVKDARSGKIVRCKDCAPYGGVLG